MKNKNFNGLFYGRQTPTDYEIKKAEARQLAIDFQNEFYKKKFYYSELAESTENFYKLGKRYGLVKEFKENGII